MGSETGTIDKDRMNILLVGNGPSVLKAKHGKAIDAFDGPVVRFNSYRLPGYEDYVGTRTDYWVTTDIFPAWHKEYQEVILCSFNRRDDNKTVLKMKEYYPDCHNFPEWAWRETIDRMKFNAPSSGAVAATYYGKNNTVWVYGFDFFGNSRHHYGDEVKQGTNHKGKYEVEFFTGLMQEGKVRPFYNYLEPLNYTILHNIYPGYGTGGSWYANRIEKIAKEHNVKSILDWGCGKGQLVKALRSKGFEVFGYDPYVREYSTLPNQNVDMIVSTDFFEHIPESEINSIISHMFFIRPKVQYHAISNRPAVQILPDGRNAHLTIKDASWWANRLNAHILEHNENNNFTTYLRV